MVAVVTGAAGFIGQTLVRVLAERAEVLGVDRLPQPPTPGLTRITADLLDADPAVLRALAGVEQVRGDPGQSRRRGLGEPVHPEHLTAFGERADQRPPDETGCPGDHRNHAGSSLR